MLHLHYLTVNPLQENSYLLYNDEGAAAIIDPGFYSAAEQEQLSAFLEAKKLKPVLLLLTHSHLDHVFGLRWAAETYGLLPHVHPNEEKMLQMAPAMGQMWNLPFKGYEGPLSFYKPGDSFSLGRQTIEVYDTPGHSPGHVVFYVPAATEAAAGFVVAGDTLFSGSIGRTDLPGGHHETLLQSIRQKLLTLPDNTVVYSGHGPATTIGRERQQNPFLQ